MVSPTLVQRAIRKFNRVIEARAQVVAQTRAEVHLNEHQKKFVQQKHKTDYSKIQLDPVCQTSMELVQQSTIEIYGEEWNYYSNALRREVTHGFYQCLTTLATTFQEFQFLEIGSCQGLSMGIIGTMAKALFEKTTLVSVDPYFEDGYIEGTGSPMFNLTGKTEGDRINVNKSTKARALKLYETLGLSVDLIEKISSQGVIDLLKADQQFNLIYIDGSHECLNPITDFGLSLALIKNGGIIILDDHFWRDVNPLKQLADLHCEKIYETWKIAAYRINR
jgi:predicted O-methyltransferase YrrM